MSYLFSRKILKETIKQLGKENDIQVFQDLFKNSSSFKKDESYQTLKRVKNIMERLDASNRDERVILLNAVKPFLNSSRQKKIE